MTFADWWDTNVNAMFSSSYREVAQRAYAAGRSDALEEAERVPEAMVIGGRAWTHDQQVAAEALFACRDAIHRLREKETP